MRPFLLVSMRSSFMKVHTERMDAEEWPVAADGAEDAVDISAFTADVDQQTIYWVDSASRKIWSAPLVNINNNSLVGPCVLLCFVVGSRRAS